MKTCKVKEQELRLFADAGKQLTKLSDTSSPQSNIKTSSNNNKKLDIWHASMQNCVGV